MSPETLAGVIGGAVTVLGGIVAAVVAWNRAGRVERRDDFAAIVAVLQAQLAQLKVEVVLLQKEHISCREENASLRARVAELERDLAELKTNGR